MSRILPFPLLSLALLIMWLLLAGTVSPGQILLGSVVAIVGPLVLTRLEPPKARFRRPWSAVKLTFLVLQDIIRSNFAVARIILGPKPRSEISGFMVVPLDMRDPYGLALLGIIITSTPGTLWVNFDSGSGDLTIHVLDLVDESAWVRTIKHRYERLLMEIFE